METPKEYYYTYYSYEEWGMGYIGSRGCKCLPEEDINYFGSFKDKSFKPTQKIILKDDYATREEAYADEIILQEHYKVVENPHFANRAYQTSTKFYVPTEQARETGRKVGNKHKENGTGIFAITPEQRRENSKKNGLKIKKNKIGVCGLTLEQRIENGKKAAKTNKENGTGIYGLTAEQRIENGKKCGNKVKELGLGIHALTTEQRRENGKKSGKLGGKKTKELGLGIHGLTKEQRIENGKIIGQKSKESKTGICGLSLEQRIESGKNGGKISASQKWKCTITGYVSNAGGLSNYQRKRGIDTINRIRIL